jgi:hypothetical protein
MSPFYVVLHCFVFAVHLLFCCTRDAQAVAVLVPCGVTSVFTVADTVSGMQLIIRDCRGSNVVGGVETIVSTQLLLDFRNSSAATMLAENVSVVVENSGGVISRWSAATEAQDWTFRCFLDLTLQ